MIYKRNRLEKKKNKAKKAKPRGNHHHFKSIKPRTPRREMKKKRSHPEKRQSDERSHDRIHHHQRPVTKAF